MGMTAIDKIHKLEELYGWRALNYCETGNGTPPRKWWVTWDNEMGPQMFNTYQAFHAYLNKKLGVYA
jgi:hypothetical protein